MLLKLAFCSKNSVRTVRCTVNSQVTHTATFLQRRMITANYLEEQCICLTTLPLEATRCPWHGTSVYWNNLVCTVIDT